MEGLGDKEEEPLYLRLIEEDMIAPKAKEKFRVIWRSFHLPLRL